MLRSQSCQRPEIKQINLQSYSWYWDISEKRWEVNSKLWLKQVSEQKVTMIRE